jgi:hypothetical protein
MSLNFSFWIPLIWTARICCYFSKPKGVCKQTGLGNIGRGEMMKLSVQCTITFPITAMCVHSNTCSSVIKSFTQNYSYTNVPKFGTCFVEYSVWDTVGLYVVTTTVPHIFNIYLVLRSYNKCLVICFMSWIWFTGQASLCWMCCGWWLERECAVRVRGVESRWWQLHGIWFRHQGVAVRRQTSPELMIA